MRLLRDVRKAGARCQQHHVQVIPKCLRGGFGWCSAGKDEMGQSGEPASDSPQASSATIPRQILAARPLPEPVIGVCSTSVKPRPNQLARGPAQNLFHSVRPWISSGHASASLSTDPFNTSKFSTVRITKVGDNLCL